MSDTMSAAEVAALRTLMGLSLDQLAEAIGRNRRVVRYWEAGRYAPNAESVEALWALKARHDDLVAEMLDADAMVIVPRRHDAPPARQNPDGVMPRGWYLAAAGRAIAEEPDLMVEWDDAPDDPEG